jgi:hypothetical protein
MSAEVDHAGRTTIEPRAIRAVATAVAASSAGVAPRDVRTALSAARGELAVSIVTPLRQPRTGTILDGATGMVAEVAARVRALTGRSVGRVEVRLTGVHPAAERRVR